MQNMPFDLGYYRLKCLVKQLYRQTSVHQCVRFDKVDTNLQHHFATVRTLV